MELHSTVELAGMFRMKKKGATLLLKALGVPTFALGVHEYFSIYTLEQALFMVTELGGPGFAAPASLRKSVVLPVEEHKARSNDPNVNVGKRKRQKYHDDVTTIQEWFKRQGKDPKDIKITSDVLKRMKMASEARMKKVGHNLTALLSGKGKKIDTNIGEIRRRPSREATPEHRRDAGSDEGKTPVVHEPGPPGGTPGEVGVGDVRRDRTPGATGS